jgi:hypothetical protein
LIRGSHEILGTVRTTTVTYPVAPWSAKRLSARDIQRASQCGVALLEVLTASVIVMIAMIGLALMFSMGSSYVAAEGGERVALFLAQQRLEELRAIGLARAVTEAEGPIPGFPGFLRSTTIAAGTDLDGAGDVPRTITVSVRSLVRQAGPISVTASYVKH